jgi:signal transduction histidine kinase
VVVYPHPADADPRPVADAPLPERRRSALATAGLATTLVVLAAIVIVATIDAFRTGATSTRELSITSACEDVLDAVTAEHEAQQQYLGSPYTADPAGHAALAREAHATAVGRIADTTNRLLEVGGPDDRALVAEIRSQETSYAAIANEVFAATDGGNQAHAEQLAHERMDAPYADLRAQVMAMSRTHRARASTAIDHFAARSRKGLVVVPAAFAMAFVFLAGCWAVLLRMQRTLRRRGEELSSEKSLLAGVISAIPHLVFWKDASGAYEGVNHAFVLLHGAVGDEGQPEPDENLAAPLSRALAGIEQEAITRGTPVIDRQVTIPRPDGHHRCLLLSVLPRVDGTGTVNGVIGVGADVTHVSELERQLAHAGRLEAIGKLAAGIAHEINTPVQYVSHNTKFLAQTITSVLSGLREVARLAAQDDVDTAALRAAVDELDLDLLTEEIPSALAESQEGLDHVAKIVRAMKDFSHPGQGRSPADLNQAIDSTVQVSRSEWGRVAELELDLDPEVGLVPCYLGEVKQALLNVVVNAAQAIAESQGRTGAGQLGRITISSHAGPDTVRIVVGDNGPGMEEAVRARVFDPFFTTKEVGQGTGQGLSLAYGTMVKHGGSLEVASTPGTGATFTFTFPRTAPDAGNEPAGSEPAADETRSLIG